MRDSKNYTMFGAAIVVVVIALSFLYIEVFVTPSTFPDGKVFTVNENETLKNISVRLEKEGYISSPLLFRAGVSFFGKDKEIKTGGYAFPTGGTLLGVINTFVQGRPSSPLLSVTIPEGSTSAEIALIIHKAIPLITEELFNASIAKNMAYGKLFPSTYFLLPSNTADDVVKVMLTTFSKKTAAIDFVALSKPFTNQLEVLSLASILEGEAKNKEDMEIVSGILLTRLTMGMPLQVDVAKETYKQRGLPVMPINNPGLVAINAALHPIKTEYLYYITGKDGFMHYAKTFEEHKRNIQKYLR